MKNKSLKTYASLARIRFPKSYCGKIMLVVFVGTHLPLVALVLYLLLATPGGLGTHLGVLAALLIATLLGFVATLWVRTATRARTIYGNCWQRQTQPCTGPKERDERGYSPARARVAWL